MPRKQTVINAVMGLLLLWKWFAGWFIPKRLMKLTTKNTPPWQLSLLGTELPEHCRGTHEQGAEPLWWTGDSSRGRNCLHPYVQPPHEGDKVVKTMWEKMENLTCAYIPMVTFSICSPISWHHPTQTKNSVLYHNTCLVRRLVFAVKRAGYKKIK